MALNIYSVNSRCVSTARNFNRIHLLLTMYQFSCSINYDPSDSRSSDEVYQKASECHCSCSGIEQDAAGEIRERQVLVLKWENVRGFGRSRLSMKISVMLSVISYTKRNVVVEIDWISSVFSWLWWAFDTEISIGQRISQYRTQTGICSALWLFPLEMEMADQTDVQQHAADWNEAVVSVE